MIHITLAFRLYPTKAQTLRIEQSLDLHRELYNAALEERRDRVCRSFAQDVPVRGDASLGRADAGDV